MPPLVRPPSIACADCGRDVLVNSRGPLPTFCIKCRRTHRDPVKKAGHRTKWKENNPESKRRYQKKWCRTTKYGMTETQWRDLYERQGKACAICRAPAPLEDLVVDHDHRCCPFSGSCGACVRGLLCQRDNLLLGQIEKAVDRLGAMAEYVLRGGT